MTKRAVEAVFALAVTNSQFRMKFENPTTRAEALRKYNHLWQAKGGLDDDEHDILLESTGTKISDISIDFDTKKFYEKD